MASFTETFKLIGKSWSALLDFQHLFHLIRCALMYAASKVIRAAHSFKEDNYIDALNYLRKAEQLQRQKMVKIINFPNSPKSETQIQAEALEMKKISTEISLITAMMSDFWEHYELTKMMLSV